ncbi:phytanoyl-CoA dioxygenase family protein [Paenibacillus mendelii]|uniref:Phytanoyl-CoA dioxygenase family protein n=1 Tax=Paenibacillus mendelii TaxID=206163 RepID=A0ABV6JFT5_9BACL|nr:phytanoyl-CoA dioxygenase family protein [Paenibacillus mendelii]MCQ6557658.1 phytanoyl-CoA dioxygenase family protein [Paenibacillus mendelii]
MSKLSIDPQEINKRLYPLFHIHEPLASPSEWKEEHISQFRQQGFLAIEGILSAAEIESAKQALSDIIAAPDAKGLVEFTTPRGELHTVEEMELAVRKVYKFVDGEERLAQISKHSTMLSIVERLLGESSKLVQDMALLKPPHGGGEKPWHQDMAYGPLAFDKSVLGVWIALDEAGIDNGCMHVIPRSHMEGATPHYALRDWQICDANVPVERNIAVPLKPGGILIFHGLLYHGTPYNFSSKRRRALQFHYAPESVVKLGMQEYKRIFTNELTNAEC